MALSGYGLVPTGLLVPSRDTIRADFNADFRGKRGASLDLSDDDPLGQFVGLLCDRLHLLWLVMLVLYKSADRDAASDAALEALCMLTGTLRDEPLPSTVELVLGGVPGTVVPAKSGIKTASTGVRFTLDAAATIVAVDAWALDTTYAVGDRVHSAGVLFECRTAGDSANGGDGPGFDLGAATVVPGEPANLDDGTVVWWLIGVGTGAVDATASSVGGTQTATGSPAVASATALDATASTTTPPVTVYTPPPGASAVIRLHGGGLVIVSGALAARTAVRLGGYVTAWIPPRQVVRRR